VPSDYVADGAQEVVPWDSKARYTPDEGTVLDLTVDIQPNYDFFTDGPGYDALG
jgi:hypothetical protein